MRNVMQWALFAIAALLCSQPHAELAPVDTALLNREVDLSKLPRFTGYSFYVKLVPGASITGLMALDSKELPLKNATYDDHPAYQGDVVVAFHEVPAGPEAISGRLRGLPMVADARPVPLYHVSSAPNDTYWNWQWNFYQAGDQDIDLELARDISVGSSSILIGIIDTGIDDGTTQNHPDLSGNLLQGRDETDINVGFYEDRGWTVYGDVTTPDDVPLDEDGHGTHVAGIAGAAVTNNQTGVAGVAPGCKIVPIRAAHRRSHPTETDSQPRSFLEDDDVQRALYYARTRAAGAVNVINMSFGGPEGSGFSPQMDACYNAGIVLLASAGNEPSAGVDDIVSYPARYTNVIAVGATGNTDYRTSYSVYGGDFVDLVAPGSRRNDLETMRRSVPLHYTDFGYGIHYVKLSFHHTLYQWIPYIKECTLSWDKDYATFQRFEEQIDRFAFHCGIAAMTTPAVDINRDDYDYAQAAKLTELAFKTGGYFIHGDYYPLTPFARAEDKWVVRQFHRAADDTGFVQGIRLQKCPDDSITVFPQGLDDTKRYVFEDAETGEKREVSGAALRVTGFTLKQPVRSGAVWMYKLA